MNACVTDAAGERWALPRPAAWRLEYTAGVPCDSFWLRCPWDGGNATELGSMNWYNAVEAYGYPAPGGELDVRRGLNCYINGLGHRLSEDFDWISALTDDGRGFVGKDEKIYRIEFKEL